MVVQCNISIMLLVLSAMIATIFFAIIVRVKNKSQLHYVFMGSIVLIIIWEYAELLSTFIRHYFGNETMFFIKVGYIGVCFVPLSVYFIGYVFYHTKIKIKKIHLLLFVIPAISILLMWTNEIHGLFYIRYSIIKSELIYGKYFLIHVLYSYACVLAGLYYLVRYAIKNLSIFSSQAIIIILGIFIPFIANVLYTLKIGDRYSTPLAFTISIICMWFSSMKFNFLNIVPIALQKVVDHISDAFIVVDENLNIVDYNKSLKNIFTGITEVKRNENITYLINQIGKKDTEQPDFKDLIAQAVESKSSLCFEHHLIKGSFDKYFSVEITPMYSKGNHIGTILLFKDITEHKKNLEIIKAAQEIIMEQERLAALGQMIGGIAHNLKTPIMSISGGLEVLKGLINEYRESVGDESVTTEDHYEISEEMLSWIDTMVPQCVYMSDVITAVKGQTVQTDASGDSGFTVEEVVKRVDILMKHPLKRQKCTLSTEVQIDPDTKIKGDITSLVQVFNNLVINAAEAYDGKGGVVELNVYKEDKNIKFIIKDTGKGMSQEVKRKLFKSMITTKGKYGTGLGLYISYPIIKGRFNGSIKFDSEDGKGTTFYVTIPL